MTISIILIIVFFIGHELTKGYNFLFFGICLEVFSALYFTIHIALWSTASYRFEVWAIERNSFINTVDKCRNINDKLENSAITKDIIEWNRLLALSKMMNKEFLLKDYIDNRAELLEPIY